MKTTFLILLSCILTINSFAQEKQITKARAWKTFSLLPGKPINEAISLLAKEGLPDYKKHIDPATSDLVYFFYAANVKEQDYEPDYKTYCVNGKIVMVSISYEYSDNNSYFKNELSEMKNTLKSNGFTQKNKKRELEESIVYDYISNKQNTIATLLVDENLATFNLILGEVKFVKMATE